MIYKSPKCFEASDTGGQGAILLRHHFQDLHSTILEIYLHDVPLAIIKLHVIFTKRTHN